VIGRLVASVDYERVLGTPPRARSVHFAVHHLPAGPSGSGRPTGPRFPELSTEQAPVRRKPVDESPGSGHWLGAVVPKRHARRSVTRSLLKRQIRSRLLAHEETLAPGLWVVRLRAPFDLARFPSAASAALREAAGAELDTVFARAAADRVPR
jgi:ribonuclease P protein component